MTGSPFLPCETPHLKIDWLTRCEYLDQIALSVFLQKFMLAFSSGVVVYNDEASVHSDALVFFLQKYGSEDLPSILGESRRTVGACFVDIAADIMLVSKALNIRNPSLTHHYLGPAPAGSADCQPTPPAAKTEKNVVATIAPLSPIVIPSDDEPTQSPEHNVGAPLVCPDSGSNYIDVDTGFGHLPHDLEVSMHEAFAIARTLQYMPLLHVPTLTAKGDFRNSILL